jgi:hypothetical protein
MKHARKLGLVSLILAACVALPACSGSSKLSGDPLTDARDPGLSTEDRAKAVHLAWAETEPGTSERESVRQSLKDLAWAPNAPAKLRLAALDELIHDTNPESLADSRTSIRLLLPTEQDRGIVTYIAEASARYGWTEMTPALVRQYARPIEDEPDAARIERTSLERLHPGVPVEKVAFDVFLNPGTDPGPYKARWDLRTRAAAWDLLGRLDADGSLRAQLLSSDSGISIDPSDRALTDLRACLAELRTVPRNGEELRWLDNLRDPKNRANGAWWQEVRSVVSNLTNEQAQGLRLMHLEHVRVASQRSPDWLRAGREELLSSVRSRLDGRPTHQRSRGVDFTRQISELLRDQEDRFSWGDLLTVLVLDDAIRDPRLVEALFGQVELDRKDTTTEYGGMIATGQSGYVATMYPPRPSNRLGDRKFIASDDLITSSDRALAHYHFHVQRVQNREYAGPSDGDLDYAARLGRVCVVFTSLDAQTLNADLYFPGGYVLDLGQITR